MARNVTASGQVVKYSDDQGTIFVGRFVYLQPLAQAAQFQPFTSVSTTPYNVGATDSLIVVSTAGGNVVVNLPSAALNAGRELIIKKNTDDANTVTVIPNGSDAIDGQLSVGLPALMRSSLTVVSDGVSNWMVIA